MTIDQILLVKNSWGFVVLKSPDAGNLFYSRLFDVAPEMKPLFKDNVEEQARKLVNMVTLIVSKLNNMKALEEQVKFLAIRHVKYGTKPEHYPVVGECLVWTLKQGLGEKWNDETEEAWRVIYRQLSNAMIGSIKVI